VASFLARLTNRHETAKPVGHDLCRRQSQETLTTLKHDLVRVSSMRGGVGGVYASGISEPLRLCYSVFNSIHAEFEQSIKNIEKRGPMLAVS
jgi:hypothetical protein